ncbi:MAG: Arc family DNA-binding protein [Pseudomonadales bacterium]
MAKRKPFALRIDEEVLGAMQRYADDELRSLNAQIEYLLRQSLRAAGRLPSKASDTAQEGSAKDSAAEPEDDDG